VRHNVFRDPLEEALAVEAVRRVGPWLPGEKFADYLERINAERDEPDYWPDREPGEEG
jgi:hypothetical protein